MLFSVLTIAPFFTMIYGMLKLSMNHDSFILKFYSEYNYRPRSKGDNTFGSIRPSVRLSVVRPSVSLFACGRSPV